MKKLLCSVAIATSLFCSTAYSQQPVLSCLVKTASGDAITRSVDNVKVGTTLDIPVDMLVANGSTYEGRDLFHTERTGESTTIIISRETGEFEFSASSGMSGPGWGTSKKAAGVCKIKKMKL